MALKKSRRWQSWLGISIAVMAIFLFMLAWIARQQRADIASGQTRAPLQISSSSFVDGRSLARKFTCDGLGISPSLQWAAPPVGTRSLAVVMDDRDAPFGFVHWLVYNIPPGTRDLAEGASPHGKLPAGTNEGVDTLGSTGYAAPCPPGAKPHHYVLSVYALDASLDLPPAQTRKQLAAAVRGHVLAEGQITGLYVRGSR